ncbi:hypothetical protein ACFLZ9_02065 [Patescibacteria group bacterium]
MFMENHLIKVLKLAKKTGDRLIVFNPFDAEITYVVMSIDEYEKLVIGKSEVRDLTEEELLDKINRDIAIWKSEQELDKNKPENYNIISSIQEENRDKKPKDIKEIIEDSKTKGRSFWSIPPERKKAAEEIIDEDRQYLEEVSF